MSWTALCLALWPVWLWYYQRLTDRSDEPLGLVALITFFALLWVHPQKISRGTPPPVVTLLLLVYALSLLFVPKLILAILAVVVIGLSLSGRKWNTSLDLGDWSLLFLSLPLVASLNFYLGYPLRLLVGTVAAALLNINGFKAVAQGTALIYSGQAIEIDAPCSGVRMLWAALYLAATLSSLRGLRWFYALPFMLFAFCLAILANVLRVTSLFYVETGIVSLPHEMQQALHEGVGVAIFLILAITLLLIAGQLALRQTKSEKPIAADSAEQEQPETGINSAGRWRTSFFVVCAACAVLPVFVAGPKTPVTPSVMPAPASGWPASLSGVPLQPVALSARTEQLVTAFPGQVKIFASGKQTVIYRYIEEATRLLHPAADCYRAAGYEIKYTGLFTDTQGLRWGACEAARGAEHLLLHERLFDDHGGAWTDVSAWYWSALLGKTKAPWWSVVTVTAVP